MTRKKDVYFFDWRLTFNPPLNTLFYFQTPLAGRCLPPQAECPHSVSFTFSFIASGSGVTLRLGCLGCLHRVMLKLFKYFHVKYFANNTKSKVYMQCNHFILQIVSLTHGIILILSFTRNLLVVPIALTNPHAPLPAAAHRLRGSCRGFAPARRGCQQPGSVFSVKLRVSVPRSLGSSSGQPRDRGAGVWRGDRQWPVERVWG